MGNLTALTQNEFDSMTEYERYAARKKMKRAINELHKEIRELSWCLERLEKTNSEIQEYKASIECSKKEILKLKKRETLIKRDAIIWMKA